MTSDALTIVVPVGTGPLGDAVAQAYRHLVSCDLVAPCVWVLDSATEVPMATVIGDGANGDAGPGPGADNGDNRTSEPSEPSGSGTGRTTAATTGSGQPR